MSRFSVTLCIIGLLAIGSSAQTPEIQAQVKSDLEALRDEQRAEDVEILRRILNKSLGMPDRVAVQPRNQPINPTWVYPNTLNQPTTQPLIQPYFPTDPNSRNPSFPQAFDYYSNLTRTTSAFGPFDGVYLAGQGIVYTLHIPENVDLVLDPPAKAIGLSDFCRRCHETVSKGVLEGSPAADTPLTEWDRVRKELQGQPAVEKPASPTKLTREQICEPGNLAELILGALSRNSKNIRNLAKGDKIAVIVTFDGLGGTSRDRRVVNLATPSGLKPPTTTESKGIPDRLGFSVEESQQLTLGDLHLKQNKPKEAVAAYQRGLSRFKDAVARIARPRGLSPVQQGEMAAELQKGIRDAYSRLAQAQIALGDIAQAQSALTMAQTFKIELVSGATASGKEKRVVVPAKLIITLAKDDIEKVGDDIAALKKTAKVETVGFPPADRAK